MAYLSATDFFLPVSPHLLSVPDCSFFHAGAKAGEIGADCARGGDSGSSEVFIAYLELLIRLAS